MSLKRRVALSLKYLRLGLAFMAMFQFALGAPLSGAGQPAHDGGRGPDRGGNRDNHTQTPIKHVIVIIGENRTFDHIFATYEPKHGQKIWNLLSEGIVNEDGTPGPNYSEAVQNEASDPSLYEVSPTITTAFTTLPPPLTGGPKTPGFATIAQAKAAENGLAPGYYKYMTSGGTDQDSGVPDARILYDGYTATNLPSGPFQLTPGVPYDGYAASPVHRFYQMWQQLDCNIGYATDSNPSGCRSDLFPWVEVTEAAGSNGHPAATHAYDAPSGEGATAMGFYNVLAGDAPYLKHLADTYSMSDNYHQAVQGGTGANHIMLGTGDAMWFQDANGNAAMPPHNQAVFGGTTIAGTVDEIENPNPDPTIDSALGFNWYLEDGYGGGGNSKAVFGGGSYSDCSDSSQAGVAPVLDYLASLPYNPKPNCDSGHYYLLNNYNPGFFGDGTNAYTTIDSKNTPFTIPPSTLRNIGDELLENNISWRYYGDQWDNYLKDPEGLYSTPDNSYCNICNFFQYSVNIMTHPAIRTEHLKDTIDLYDDIANGWLPAVSFVKPSGLVDGHPASSKLDLFEGFVKKIVDEVKSQPKLWKSTAIFVTFDEGGGYWDSGYVQPLDFFGDGTRIPMIVVSPWSTGGYISHTYTDHVSILKFIEANWGLSPLTERSRDNLSDPKSTASNPYVPTNSPAIGDMMDLFHFNNGGH
jgi:phospholipase C